MPSRLGDDPLARAGRGTAKPAGDAPASPIAFDSIVGPATPQPGVRPESNAAVTALQRSYNDVFFLRRGEAGGLPATDQVEQKTNEPTESREISEVSEIPEIREIAAAPIVGSERDAGSVAEPSQPQETVKDADAQGATASASPETVATVETGEPVAQPAAQVEALVAPGQEPSNLSSSVPDSSESDPTVSQEGSGLFKKVFDKFGK